MPFWRRQAKDPAQAAQEREAELVKAFHMADFGGRSRTVDVYYERHKVTLQHAIEVAAANGYEFVRTKHTRMGPSAEFKLRPDGS
jgi:hypothetical protein